jgi:hypothetical protein
MEFPKDVHAYLLTDQVQGEPPAPYRKILIHNPPYPSARQNARYYKLLPPKDLWDACDVSIQLDANVDLLVHPVDLVHALAPTASLGLVRHPFLSNYQAEISHLCQVYPRDCDAYERTRDKYMQQEGFDPTSPQYETSFMIRRHTPQVRDAMEAWKDALFSSGHLRDQVVLAPILHSAKLQIQLYRGHNVDFSKWRCHAKVMGQQRSGAVHAAYCTLYYGVKRYTPWVERLAPLTFGMIAAFHLDEPIPAGMVLVSVVMLMVVLWMPQRRCRHVRLRRRVRLALQGAVAMAVAICILLAAFYTGTMGIAALWPSIWILTPLAYLIMPMWNGKHMNLVHANKKDDHEVVVESV